jgi:aspartate carbamoyltransferase regulatory subunit
MAKAMLVEKIEAGTVIDHVPATRAPMVLRLLGDPETRGYTVAVVMNAKSRRLGQKDIVKVEKLEISKAQVDRLAVIAPDATVNRIRNYRVVGKTKVEPERRLTGILRCPSPTCISSRAGEPVKSKFELYTEKPLTYACVYCSRQLSANDFLTQLIW